MSVDDGVQKELMNLENSLATKLGVKQNAVNSEQNMTKDGAVQFHPKINMLFDTRHERISKDDAKSSEMKHHKYRESKFVNNVGNASEVSHSSYSKSATLTKSEKNRNSPMSIEIQENEIDALLDPKSMFLARFRACVDSERIKNNATSYTFKYDRNIRIKKSNSTNKRKRRWKSTSENYVSSHASEQISNNN